MSRGRFKLNRGVLRNEQDAPGAERRKVSDDMDAS